MIKKIVIDKNCRRIIKIWFILKLSTFLLIILGFLFLPHCQDCWEKNYRVFNNAWSLSASFSTWDGQHFLGLSRFGYGPDFSNNAFYPLYPFLLKIASLPIGNYLLAGLLLSNLFFLISTILFYYLVKDLYTSRLAFYSTLLFIFFPTAFFGSLLYAESLFLFLAVLFFYSLVKNKIFTIVLTAFLLPLCKAQGILILLPGLIFLIQKKLPPKYYWLIFLGFIIGFLSYLGVMQYFTGSLTAGFSAQSGVVSGFSLNNLFNLKSWFLRNFVFNKLVIHGFTTSMLDRGFFLFFIYLLILAWKKLPKYLFFYSALMVIIPALADSFMSYTRYLWLAFPLFIVLAQKFKKDYYLLVALMLGLQIIFIISHSLNYWIA